MDIMKGRGFIRIVLLVLFGIIFLSCCGSGISEEPKSVEQLILDKTELTIVISEEGPESEALKVTVTPAKANYGNLNWSSSNEKVVTVDRSGKVTALSAGKAVVTAQSRSGKKAECKVAVHLGSTKLKFTLSESGEFYTVTGRRREGGAVIVIPPKYQGKPVEVIGKKAFSGCKSFTSVVISDSVKAIESLAFCDCSELTSIIIPNSVETIGSYAFYKCKNLTSVVIPDSIETIEDYTFSGCNGLRSIIIPNSVKTIGDRAFEECGSLSSIVIPDSVETIGSWAFRSCTNLRTVTIPNSVKTIGNGAFYYCKSLSHIELPDSVETVEYAAFANCSPSLEVSYEGAKIPDEWNAGWDVLDEAGTKVNVKFLD